VQEERRAEEDRRSEEDRRGREWEEARDRMEEQQEAERQAAELRRDRVREGRQAGSGRELDTFRSARWYVGAGVGGVSVSRLVTDGTLGEVGWTTNGEIAYLVPIKSQGIALGIGVSYANLPVSACSQAQTRASAVALHVGPRIPIPLRNRAWLSIRASFHAGAAGTWPGDSVRDRCHDLALENSDDPVAYGVRLTDGDAQGKFSYADLGWRGGAVVIGPDVEVGILVGAGKQAPVYLGGAFFLRHDQVLAVIRGDTYHFRQDGNSLALASASLGSLDGKASMARFQFGLRGTVMF